MHEIEHAVAGLKRGDAGADLIDHADALMTEDAAGRASRHVAFEDVQVGAADRRLDDLDDGIGRRSDFGIRTIFQGLLSRPVIDERLHIVLPGSG